MLIINPSFAPVRYWINPSPLSDIVVRPLFATVYVPGVAVTVRGTEQKFSSKLKLKVPAPSPVSTPATAFGIPFTVPQAESPVMYSAMLLFNDASVKPPVGTFCRSMVPFNSGVAVVTGSVTIANNFPLFTT